MNVDYTKTAIWNKFESQPDIRDFEFVKEMVEDCIPLLQRIPQAFSKYTDHAGVHQVNILNLMGKILGDRIVDLTTLECAFLILSTYMHDIGMVFKDEELMNLSSDSKFLEFLHNNPAPNKIYHEKGEIVDSELAEWFCRWNHAFRVHKYLEYFERNKPDCLMYRGVSLRQKLGIVCESHNWSAETIRKDDRFVVDFFSGAGDLRFCTVLLRLADYLDFDNSRSPKSLYNFLDLDDPKTYSDEVSRKEWRKHLSSLGFTWPTTKNRELPYEINYLANPNNINTHQEIRIFLDGIEAELLECAKVIDYCSPRWRNFKLPSGIKREIHSQGYKYGDFNFKLNQKQVLNLLMGENLYSDAYVFIRELLQNAIDTSRHREFSEQALGKVGFKVKPIEVSTWEDEDGYRWIRFDDYGMGMNEPIIKNFLLNIGTSYYNSDEFKVEQLNYQRLGSDFTPISRFGIGLLSCFIVGDRVEISTRKRGFSPIRLSIDGLQDYYTLQTDEHIPNPMPKQYKNEDTYRVEEGTAISVRLNPIKEVMDFDLKSNLENWLFCPPVPVLFEGLAVGGDFEDLDKPFCEENTVWLDDSDVKKIEEYLGESFSEGLGVTVTSYDISGRSFSDGILKGKAIIAKLTHYEAIKYPFSVSLSIPSGGNEFHKHFDYNFNEVELSFLLDRRIPNISLVYDKSPLDIKIKGLFKNGENNASFFNQNRLKLFHNGISADYIKISEAGYFTTEPLKIFGYIALFDKLRPSLSVSRDKISGLSWDIKSNLCFGLFDYMKSLPNPKGNIIEGFGIENTPISFLRKDELITSDRGWRNQTLFYDSTERWNVEEMEQRLRIGVDDKPESYLTVVGDYYLQNMNASILIEDNKAVKWEISDTLWSNEPDLEHFPPLYFVSFKEDYRLLVENSRNVNHPFSKWFISANYFLKVNYPDIYKTIKNNLKMGLSDKGEDKANNLNKCLDRIRKMKHFPKDYMPHAGLLLSKEDFFWKYETITSRDD